MKDEDIDKIISEILDSGVEGTLEDKSEKLNETLQSLGFKVIKMDATLPSPLQEHGQCDIELFLHFLDVFCVKIGLLLNELKRFKYRKIRKTLAPQLHTIQESVFMLLSHVQAFQRAKRLHMKQMIGFVRSARQVLSDKTQILSAVRAPNGNMASCMAHEVRIAALCVFSEVKDDKFFHDYAVFFDELVGLFILMSNYIDRTA